MSRASPAEPLLEWPSIDVVVPVQDEEVHIAGKIENLLALAYPGGKLAFWIVDGNSRDATRDIARAATEGDPRFAVVRTGVANKAAQMNHVFPLCRGEWILVTDADARLAPDTLKRLVREGDTAPRAGAVGTSVIPLRAHSWETLHWRIADRARLREAARASASIVTGPCYLMRRGLVDRFPPSVIADDVHVAFCAASSGLRTGFIDGRALELRAPLSIAELLRHKFRKAHACLREVFRFAPAALGMPAPIRTIFLRHAAQMTLSAPVGVLLAAAFLAAAFHWRLSPGLPICTAGAALALVGLVRRPGAADRLGLTVLLLTALLAALASAPFWRPHPSYRRIDERGAPEPEFESP